MNRSFVLRMPNWIGDAVMATAALEDLIKAFPQASITLVCQGIIHELFEKHPGIHQIIKYQKPNGWLHHITAFPLVQQMRAHHFSNAILFTNSFSSAWHAFLARIPQRVGFSLHRRHYLLTHPIPPIDAQETTHHVLAYKKLLAPYHIPTSQTYPKLFLTPQEQAWAQSFLHKTPQQPKCIGINPGAAYGSAKCWPIEKFRELIEKILTHTDHKIFLFGDPSLIPTTQKIHQGLGSRVTNLAGRTSVRQLLALIDACDAFVSNDSGPMHIAAACQTPLIALFGSTNPTKTGPYGQATVFYKHASCSPCYLRTCPIDFRCMQQISSQEVFEALKRLMEPS